MIEKKYINCLIISIFITIICIGIINYLIDPLLYYPRSNRFFQILYSEEQRYQVPGLIKNSQDHNVAIIGTSMAGNFLASEVSELLNEKTIKLTINGATFTEQSYVISHYLDAHPDSKIIIWGVDPIYVDIDPDKFTLQPYTYPFFLYDNKMLNLKYLLNYTVTLHSFQTIANNLFEIRFLMKIRNLDELHTWPLDTPVGCKPVIENYNKLSRQNFKIMTPFLMPSTVFDKANANANLNKIVDLAESNKSVQFYIYLPPYSIVRYLFEDELNGFERILEARNFIADKINGIGNIKVIDLQASEDIISNLDYYMDMIHHTKEINNLIIRAVADGNFDGYESILENTEKLRSLADKYNFEEIKKCAL